MMARADYGAMKIGFCEHIYFYTLCVSRFGLYNRIYYDEPFRIFSFGLIRPIYE